MNDRMPDDFPTAAHYVATRPAGAVPVYVDTRTGRFCASVPERGYLERPSHAALAKEVRAAGLPFDAILTNRNQWNGGLPPDRIRVVGYRKNPKYGGKWVYRKYVSVGDSQERLSDYQDQTDAEIIPWSESNWLDLTVAYAAMAAARSAYNLTCDSLPVVPKPGTTEAE